MKKSNFSAAVVNSQNDNFDKSQFEVVHSGGFSPMWKPTEKNSFVVISPFGIRKIEQVSGKGKNKRVQENYLLESKYVSGNTVEFYSSKTQTEVIKGDTISIPLSTGLLGEMALGVHTEQDNDESPIIFSPLVDYCNSVGANIMVQFVERVPLKGGQSFKKFVVFAPKGIREKMSKSKN